MTGTVAASASHGVAQQPAILDAALA